MTEALWHIGDTRAVLAAMPDNSVDLVVTSPPFLALRSYLPADHPDKGSEIGSEATPGEFLDVLLDVVVELRRVVAPHGSICVELGDTYSGSGGAGGDYSDEGLRAEQPLFDGSAKRTRASGARTAEESHLGVDARNRARRGGNAALSRGDDWPEAKSLCLIPQSFAWALAYGRNPFTGRTLEPWRVRNIVRWCRPNPPVGWLGDKFRPATSEMTVVCVARDRYFDLDAVRTPPSQWVQRYGGGDYKRPNHKANPNRADNGDKNHEGDPAGAPPLDYWEIPTQPYAGSHYATFPERLVVRPIEAMCPRRVCTVCGEPSRRITAAFTLDSYRASTRSQTVKAVALADEHSLTDEHIAAIRAFGTSDAGKATVLNNGAGKNTDEVKRLAEEAKAVLGGYFREFVQSTEVERESTWSDCGHDDWRTGIVLDPFAGSGTTGVVALGHGRDFVGIDLDSRNAELARDRIGPMFFTEATTEGATSDDLDSQ